MEENPQEPKDEEKLHKDSVKHKLSDAFETLKENQNIESFLNYAKSHTQDTIAYLLMVIGIIWMFFHSFYGGILIGLISSFYFSKDIAQSLKSSEAFVENQGIAKCIVLGMTLLALFIAAPGIIIGAAIMAGIMIMLKQI